MVVDEGATGGEAAGGAEAHPGSITVTARTTASEVGDRVEVSWALSAAPGLEWTEVFQFTEVAGRRDRSTGVRAVGPTWCTTRSGGSSRWTSSTTPTTRWPTGSRWPTGGVPGERVGPTPGGPPPGHPHRPGRTGTERWRLAGTRPVRGPVRRPGRRRLAAGRAARALPGPPTWWSWACPAVGSRSPTRWPRPSMRPLDVIVVRKLGVPFQPEVAMGAIGEDGRPRARRAHPRPGRVSPWTRWPRSNAVSGTSWSPGWSATGAAATACRPDRSDRHRGRRRGGHGIDRPGGVPDRPPVGGRLGGARRAGRAGRHPPRPSRRPTRSWPWPFPSGSGPSATTTTTSPRPATTR